MDNLAPCRYMRVGTYYFQVNIIISIILCKMSYSKYIDNLPSFKAYKMLL